MRAARLWRSKRKLTGVAGLAAEPAMLGVGVSFSRQQIATS
jgi:hypothetical protein